ncbi:UTRA domain-containing protein [Cellulomonas sp. Sa3CUA2]|uniref:UTRA domain-containing protein n=1 Tax=Cellulomonas avistercoris TaxID=2762242 RepID=A0ABR8QEX3_9CELL|nr:UTRA domain-containing protein [Cellulomonas avistercoris]MBD7918959.1 UTRA domain-containing protein [Cellulomonas avistercoris]
MIPRRHDHRPTGVELIQCLPSELRGAPSGAVTIHELEHRVVASTAYVRERLRRDDETVILIEQEVRAAGRPLYVRVGYHPVELGLERLSAAVRDVDTRASIPDARAAFRLLFGRELGSSDTVLEAAAADVATARVLGLEPGDPVLLREQLLCDVDGVPWSLSWVHYRSDVVMATTARGSLTALSSS